MNRLADGLQVAVGSHDNHGSGVRHCLQRLISDGVPLCEEEHHLSGIGMCGERHHCALP